MFRAGTLPNFFFWQHALLLLPFIVIGQWLRSRETLVARHGARAAALFLLAVGVLTLAGFETPTITRDTNTTPLTFPLFLALSTLGTAAAWWVAMRVRSCRLLEFWGRGSIAMYAFNYATLLLSGHALQSLLSLPALRNILAPGTSAAALLLFLLTVAVATALLSALTWLVQLPGVRIILGRRRRG